MLFQLFIISAVTLTAFCQYPSSQQYGSSSQPRYSPSSQLGSTPRFSSAQPSVSSQYNPSQFSSAQPSPSSQYNPSQFSSNQYLTTPPPQSSFPPAQVHYVNIGADLAGDYKFGYDTGKGPLGQSFREESRLPDGTVSGAYGYVDANGKQRIVKYTAGKEGFKVEGDTEADPSEPASAPRPASPPAYRQPAPQTYSQPAPQVYRQPPPQSYAQPAPQSYRQPAPQQYRPASPGQTIRQAVPLSIPPPLPYSLEFTPSGPTTTIRGQPTSSYTQSFPPQTYRSPSQSSQNLGLYRPQPSPNLGSYRPTPPSTQPIEDQTYGPPVINTALLNYNIGSQQG